jgi:hypothetical protein
MDDVPMTEQPGYVLEEAVKLFVAMGRRMGDTGRTVRRDDVWSRATREEHPRIATGAPECKYCPICRTIAASRESGTDVAGHVMNAGQELFAAMREALSAYDRTRPPGRSAHRREGSGGDPIDVG